MDINKALRIALDYQKNGALQQAEVIYKEILKLQPKNAEVLHLLGIIGYERADFKSAIQYINESVRLKPLNAEAQFDLGNIYREMGLLDEAIQCYRMTLNVQPNLADAYNNIGLAYHDQKNLDEAIINYKKAIQLDPDFFEAYNNLGLAYQEKGQSEDAMRYCQKSLQLNPNYAEAYNNLGIIFQDKGEIEKAVDYYLKAIDLNATIGQAYCNIGSIYHEQAKFKEALEIYTKGLSVIPSFPGLHYNLALLYLLLGNLKEGWKEYAWRWRTEKFQSVKRNFSQPVWDGSNISGQTILLYGEQGYGDTIQFIRYADKLAKQKGKVYFSCPQALKRVLSNISGVHKVIVYGESLPQFDVHCSILDLPKIFQTHIDSIPARIPYIKAFGELVQHWRQKINAEEHRLKIGLVWAGDPRLTYDAERSIPLERFLPVAHINDIDFFSLQKRNVSKQAKNPPKGLELIDYTEDIYDFADTAALIENLDLVISVDTAVAHLAGAMGKNVWVLLPFVPDWRWMLNREDSPWYPTMKLFRQSSPQDWESVIYNVAKTLRKNYLL